MKNAPPAAFRVGFMAPLTRAQSPIQLPSYDPEDQGGGGGGGNGDDKKKKSKLRALLDDDDDVQAELDEIVERRLARERKRQQQRGSGGGNDDTAEELQRLREEKAERDRTEAEKQKEYEKALGLEREKFGTKETKWKEREQTLATELRAERVRNRLVAAAAKRGAVDPDEVADLLERRVAMDEKFAPSVRDPKDATKEALNADGDPMTIDELVEDYLTKRPHLAKATGDGDSAGARGGAGTHAGSHKGTQSGALKGDLAKLEAEYDAAFKLAESQPNAGNLTKMQQAKRRLDEAKKRAA